MTAPISEGVRAILEDPQLLDGASELMDDLGLCGEDLNRRMVFLAGIGGMLGEPVHLIVKGDSSGGKNTLVNTSLRLLPEDTVLATSGLSRQALAYFEDEEGRKRIDGVLFIDEAEGMDGAEYIVRQAMSEGRVGRLTVMQDESGSWGGKKLEVEVTASIITTTTALTLHSENQTRVFDLWVDETEGQTRRVLRALADQAVGGQSPSEVEEGLQIWREALGALEPLGVSVPFARELSGAFPTSQLRARRDFGRVLSLIRISALLHQRQRLRLPDGRVLATLADYGIAYRLLQHVLEPTVQGLNPRALALCELHEELASETSNGWVKRSDLEKEARARDIASRNTVHKWCKRLAELGYWEGRTRDPHRAWHHRSIRDPSEEPVLLPRPEELEGPGIPVGPSSPIGRSMSSDAGRSDGGPNPPNEEGEGHDASRDGEDVLAPFEREDWEDPETAREDGQESSHPEDWEGLGGRGERRVGKVRVPAALIDGDWKSWS